MIWKLEQILTISLGLLTSLNQISFYQNFRKSKATVLIYDTDNKMKIELIFVFNNVYVYGLIHQNWTRAHFSRDGIKCRILALIILFILRHINNYCHFNIQQIVLIMGAMFRKINFFSKGVCIVKNLERIQFDKCGRNKNWNFKSYSS